MILGVWIMVHIMGPLLSAPVLVDLYSQYPKT